MPHTFPDEPEAHSRRSRRLTISKPVNQQQLVEAIGRCAVVRVESDLSRDDASGWASAGIMPARILNRCRAQPERLPGAA